MASTPAADEANLWPALAVFTVVYLVLSAAVAALLVFLDLNSNTGVSIAVLLAATAAAAKCSLPATRARFDAASSCVLPSGRQPRRCC